MPIAQSSPFLTYQTAQKKASKPLEQSYLEGWGQNYEVFGHNHKHYIWRGVNKAYDESTPCLLWNTDVDHWCFGDVWATQAIGQNWWQGECSVFRKYWRKICTHQAGSCTWDALGHSKMTVNQNTRSGRPFFGYSRKKWRFWEWPSWSPDLNIIEPVWKYLKHVVHARQFTGYGGIWPGRMGSFTIWEN